MFFNVEGGLLTLAKEEIRNITAFKSLLERDRGSDGDNDGRKKYRAFKEFYYIWWICDVRSPGVRAGYNDKELHLQGIKEARLEDTFKPDKLIKESISYYKKNQAEQLVSSTSVINLISALRLSNNLSRRLVKSIEALIEIDDKENEERERKLLSGEQAEPINIVEVETRTNALLSRFSQIADIAKKIPPMITVLEETEKRLKVEESGSATVRGGQRKGNRMDP